MGKEKPIWRLAFFSRLEERKGIKFFVDAINHRPQEMPAPLRQYLETFLRKH